MAAVKNFDRRLTRLEGRLMPTDLALHPHRRQRIIVCRLGGTLNFERSRCKRTLSGDGVLTEIVRLDGSCVGLTDEALDQFIESFLVETSGLHGS